jgi:hypothetical protein
VLVDECNAIRQSSCHATSTRFPTSITVGATFTSITVGATCECRLGSESILDAASFDEVRAVAGGGLFALEEVCLGGGLPWRRFTVPSEDGLRLEDSLLGLRASNRVGVP